MPVQRYLCKYLVKNYGRHNQNDFLMVRHNDRQHQKLERIKYKKNETTKRRRAINTTKNDNI